jgi:hypothetical protein
MKVVLTESQYRAILLNESRNEFTNYLSNLKEFAETVITKGKELFTAMCQHCNGEKGDGNGPMVLSGAYVGVPNYDNLANLSDGQMF